MHTDLEGEDLGGVDTRLGQLGRIEAEVGAEGLLELRVAEAGQPAGEIDGAREGRGRPEQRAVPHHVQIPERAGRTGQLPEDLDRFGRVAEGFGHHEGRAAPGDWRGPVDVPSGLSQVGGLQRLGQVRNGRCRVVVEGGGDRYRAGAVGPDVDADADGRLAGGQPDCEQGGENRTDSARPLRHGARG